MAFGRKDNNDNTSNTDKPETETPAIAGTGTEGTATPAPAAPLSGEVRVPTPREKFHQYLTQRALVEGGNNADALVENQLADIFSASNPDDLWAAMALDGLTALKDLDAGELITIRGYRLSPGDPTFKMPAFAIVDAYYTRTGQELQLDTGVERVLGFLRAIESGQAGLSFPVDVKIDKKNTANGTAVTFVKP